MLREVREDYLRHDATVTNLAFWAMAVYRFGRWSLEFRGPWGWFTSRVYGVLFLWIKVTTAIELNREVTAGQGLHLIHAGNTKVHPRVVIGDRCGIMHDVTIGTVPGKDGVPRIGNDVFIGAGAKVLGAITLGDFSRVAANTVVFSDVPAGATAIGVPAVIRPSRRSPPAVPEPAARPPDQAPGGEERLRT
jgi:serine O-acetyltransferase